MDSGRLWQSARVIADAQGLRWLEFPAIDGCARCRAGQGCGAAQWSRLFGPRRATRLPLSADCPVAPGTPVRAGVPADALLRAALVAYLLPLTAFIGVLWLADRAGVQEPVTLLIALIAAGLALFAGRSLALRRLTPRIEPMSDRCGALETSPD